LNPAQFDKILRQALTLPILALLAAASALFFEIQATNNTVRQIQQADASIAQAMLVEKLIVDEESGLRGFQTTGDSRFLEPYQQDQAPLEQEVSRLAGLLADYPADHQDLESLRAAHEAWRIGFATPVIATIQAGGDASDVPLNLLGKIRIDAIRAAIDTIIRDSEARRASRIGHWRAQVRITFIALLLLSALTGLLIGLFMRRRLKDVSISYGKAQNILRTRADQLFASEQSLRTTLASICDGVIATDNEGHVRMMNDVALQLTGWKQEDAYGQAVQTVFQILNRKTREPAEDPATTVHRLDRVVNQTQDFILLNRNGSECLIDNSAAPIRDKTGKMNGIVIIFRDVTTDRKTQAALLANEKLAVAGRLAATIAHEIHNPLDSVSNLLYLMQNGTTPEEGRQFLAMAQQELTRVTQISRAMLGLYRESTAPVVIDLHEMLAGLMLLMQGRFHTLQVQVTEDVPTGLRVEGFPAELRQVFTNLITNAAEAASGQRDACVHVSALPQPASSGPHGEPREDGVVVTIADNGVGIPAHQLDQLFHPFFTTKGENGTGLGLWVSQGIIRKHGGTIDVQSSTADPTHGTRINVFLAAKPHIQLAGA
jgi:PAS domain S-box-containing protein